MKKLILALMIGSGMVALQGPTAKAEPCANCAELAAAQAKPVLSRFFGSAAEEVEAVAEVATQTSTTTAAAPSHPDVILDDSDGPSGVKWLRVLPEKVANLNFTHDAHGKRVYEDDRKSLDKNGKIIDSPAVRACKAIGAELPGDSDWFQLISRYDDRINGDLSDKGHKEFEKDFPDMGSLVSPNAHGFFASSSTVSDDKPNYARGLYRSGLGVRYDWFFHSREYDAHSVRCIVRPRR